MTDHGGDLGRAARDFAAAPRPFLDLSTGINPHSYPHSPLAASALTRLPDAEATQRLAATAAALYGAPSPAHVAAAPGTQILLPQVARLVRPGRAVILGPTYAEHRRAAALAGHAVVETDDPQALATADLAVVVNPNNPDGRLLPRGRLMAIAEAVARRGGLLVVDEAFMDVAPAAASLAGALDAAPVVVLRSFGKFFGLAGVRLGFALAAPARAGRLADELGPWAVSGAALAIGGEALADRAWQAAMRRRLATEAAALDARLRAHGLAVAGGTSLYRFVATPQAARLHAHLGRRGILLRAFERLPGALRIGLPGSAAGLARLDAGLAGWRGAAPAARGDAR